MAVYFFVELQLERLVKEYIDMLNGNGNASDKFWELEERIKKDKKHPGVMLELSKGNMIFFCIGSRRYYVHKNCR